MTELKNGKNLIATENSSARKLGVYQSCPNKTKQDRADKTGESKTQYSRLVLL